MFFPILSYGQSYEIPREHPVSIWAQENFDNFGYGVEYYSISIFDSQRMNPAAMYYVARVDNESIYVETLMQVWDFWTVDMQDDLNFGPRIKSKVIRDWQPIKNGYDKYYMVDGEHVVRVRYQHNVLLVLTKAITVKNPIQIVE